MRGKFAVGLAAAVVLGAVSMVASNALAFGRGGGGGGGGHVGVGGGMGGARSFGGGAFAARSFASPGFSGGAMTNRGVAGSAFVNRGVAGNAFVNRSVVGNAFAGRNFAARGNLGWRGHRRVVGGFGFGYPLYAYGLGGYYGYDNSCLVWTTEGYYNACGYDYYSYNY